MFDTHKHSSISHRHTNYAKKKLSKRKLIYEQAISYNTTMKTHPTLYIYITSVVTLVHKIFYINITCCKVQKLVIPQFPSNVLHPNICTSRTSTSSPSYSWNVWMLYIKTYETQTQWVLVEYYLLACDIALGKKAELNIEYIIM